MERNQERQKKLNEALSYIKRIFKRNIYSESEIRHKLSLKGFEDVSEEVIETLKEFSMINDEKFANLIANNTAEFKKYGPKRIRDILIRKGYSSSIADDAISKLDMDFFEIARSVADSFLKKRKFKNSYDAKRKLYSHLVYKGFDTQIIEEILSEMKEENIL